MIQQPQTRPGPFHTMPFPTFIKKISQKVITKLLMMPIKFTIAGNQIEMRQINDPVKPD
jgi:hypothetical protein